MNEESAKYYENPLRAQSFICILRNDYGVTDESMQRVLAAIGEGNAALFCTLPPAKYYGLVND
jgi:hypothetical protein